MHAGNLDTEFLKLLVLLRQGDKNKIIFYTVYTAETSVAEVGRDGTRYF